MTHFRELLGLENDGSLGFFRGLASVLDIRGVLASHLSPVPQGRAAQADLEALESDRQAIENDFATVMGYIDLPKLEDAR